MSGIIQESKGISLKITVSFSTALFLENMGFPYQERLS
jgi:hypothetical protein